VGSIPITRSKFLRFMPAYIALLRAVNVGGTGKLPMPELKAMCVAEGWAQVQTYIASGNVVFSARQSANVVQSALERRLLAYAGKPVGVILRTPAEMTAVLAANPFAHIAPNRSMAIFLADPPPLDALDNVKGQADEEIRLGKREIYVHYPQGQGVSKLSMAAAKTGTARNMNTVAQLAAMGAALQ
jgi:uncharacterized protein (DUF1697 family)